MSGVEIRVEKEEIRRINLALEQITGRSAEYVFSRAATKTAQEAQRILSEQAVKVYRRPRSAEIKGRSSVSSASVGRPSALIRFRSDLPGIKHFYVSRTATPTMFAKSPPYHRQKFTIYAKGHKKGAKPVGVFYRMVGRRKRFSLSVAQLNGSKKLLRNGFITTVHNNGGKDHMMVAYRENPGQQEPLPIKQVLGSSDRIMVGNVKVYGEREDDIRVRLLANCEAQLQKALSRAR